MCFGHCSNNSLKTIIQNNSEIILLTINHNSMSVFIIKIHSKHELSATSEYRKSKKHEKVSKKKRLVPQLDIPSVD